MNVTKKLLSKKLSKDLSFNLLESIVFVKSFFKLLESNSKEFNIKLHKFGTFYNKTTPERIGRNPKTLEVYKIKTSRRLSFRPSNSVKENIN